MGDLVKRLRIKARQASEAARMMAEAKSLRQESNPERRADLYMWPTPEQTVEWQAAEAITALQSQLAEARALLAECPIWLERVDGHEPGSVTDLLIDRINAALKEQTDAG